MTLVAESVPPAPAKYLAVRPHGDRAVRGGSPGWTAEVAGLLARHVFELPLMTSLVLRADGFEGTVRIGGDATDGGIAFGRAEWQALVTATEADRVWPRDFAYFCRRKMAEPSYRLDLVDALAGGQPDLAERWDVARVLNRWGAKLLGVDLAA
jgi:hypothetical protein